MPDSGVKKSRFLAGVRAGVPVMLGFIPVGVAYAIMARRAGFTAVETILMSAAVFAGASQMMAVGMYAQGAGVITMILTTFILNLRHLIMSACVFNRLKGARTGAKLLAAFGVTDETFAIFTTQEEQNCPAAFWFGLIAVAYLAWIAGAAIGAAASYFLPAVVSASLGIALYAMFIGILAPSVKRNLRLALLVSLTAVVNTVLTGFLPSSWALILSTLICAGFGVFFVELEEQGGAGDVR